MPRAAVDLPTTVALLVTDLGATRDALQMLRDAGIRIVIDDYYDRLAQHWRSLALVAEHEAAREQSLRALILASSKLRRP